MRKALITGASSGIGRELALLLADRGVDLIIHGRDGDSLQELVDEIGNKVKVTVCVAELASFQGTQTILQALQEGFPDLVINNAGFGLYGDFSKHNPQEVQQMIAANCAAVVAICQHICYWWQAEKVAGTILNVSSVLGVMPAPGATVYGATKAFITSFSEALDIELEEHGIRVLVACPGRVATNFQTRASKGKMAVADDGGMILNPRKVAAEMVEQIEKKEPFKIIDWRYRVVVFIRSLLPKRFTLKKLYKSLRARG